jgi:hypothetical protein
MVQGRQGRVNCRSDASTVFFNVTDKEFSQRLIQPGISKFRKAIPGIVAYDLIRWEITQQLGLSESLTLILIRNRGCEPIERDG